MILRTGKKPRTDEILLKLEPSLDPAKFITGLR